MRVGGVRHDPGAAARAAAGEGQIRCRLPRGIAGGWDGGAREPSQWTAASRDTTATDEDLDAFEFDRSGVSATQVRTLAKGDYVVKTELVLLVGGQDPCIDCACRIRGRGKVLGGVALDQTK